MPLRTRQHALFLVFACALVLHAQDAAQLPAALDSAGTLHVDVNAVLVPVVVRDAQGRAVGTLSQKDFTVFDQGKPQNITGFSLVRSEGSAEVVQDAGLGASAPAVATQPAFAQQRFIVILFDDRHLGVADLAAVQKAGTRMLDEPLPKADLALVLSFMGVNSGFTHENATLQTAIMKLKLHEIHQHDASQCPDIDYYIADQIENKHNDMEFQSAIEKTNNCLHLPPQESPVAIKGLPKSASPVMVEQLLRTAVNQALQIGDQDSRATLNFVRDVVKSMSKLPGQRRLILVSPGFPSSSDEAMHVESQIFDLAASFNVTISTLDARGVYTGMMSASRSGSGSIFGQVPGRATQDYSASLHANTVVMDMLANGTGGTFFHNSNDLEGGFRTLAAGPEYRYLLEISLRDVKHNGTYHALKVAVDRKDVTFQARQGYFAPASSKNRK